MDVVTVFLNGAINEEIYMEQPPGYIKKGEKDLVCKLNRSIYGLKQSSRCWNTVFKGQLQSKFYPMFLLHKNLLLVMQNA